MVQQNNELTHKQNKAIELMALRAENGMTYKEIAEEVGVAVRTVHYWKKDDDFNKVLAERASKVQQAILPEAYQTLRLIIEDEYARDMDRINAIRLLLQSQGKLTDKAELSVKVEQLDVEALLDNLD